MRLLRKDWSTYGAKYSRRFGRVSVRKPEVRVICILITLLAATVLVATSCDSSGKNKIPEAFPETQKAKPRAMANYSLFSVHLSFRRTTSIATSQVIEEIESLPSPPSCDRSLFEELKREVCSLIKDKYPKKVTSRPPRGEINRITDLVLTRDESERSRLVWSYRNLGDYNQDGSVDIKDIIPIGEHFLEPVTLENRWIDGNGDGEIDIADVTPLAENFFSDVAGYVIRGADSLTDEFTDVGYVLFSPPTEPAPLSFDWEVPDDSPKFLAVMPFSAGGALGEQSNIVERNLLPVAKFSASPEAGKAPLQVDFDASSSYDKDGEVHSYEWDFNGDGEVDYSSEEPLAQFIYEAMGLYTVRLTVTDDQAESATAEKIIVVSANNMPPQAALLGIPDSGEVPLAVTLDASGSVDVDGHITRYDWDFEGDGEFDFDSGTIPTAQYTYDKPGWYFPSVRVTDDDGSSSVAVTLIKGYKAEWIRTVGLDSRDWGDTLAVDTSGNSYVAGNWGIGDPYKPVIVKFNPRGDILWQKVVEEGPTFYLREVYSDTDPWGNLVLAGIDQTRTPERTEPDVFLVKISSEGEVLWAKRFGTADSDYSRAIACDGSGNIYMVGYMIGSVASDALIVKFSTDGNILWQKRWGHIYDSDVGFDIVVSNNMLTILVRSRYDPSHEYVVLVEFDTSGSLLSTSARAVGFQQTTQQGRIWGVNMAMDEAGNAFILGRQRIDSDYNVVVFGVAPSGDILWQFAWGGPEVESISDIEVDTQGYLYVGGHSMVAGLNYGELFLLKFDTLGNLLSQKSCADPMDEAQPIVRGLAMTGEGKLMVAGSASSSQVILQDSSKELKPIYGFATQVGPPLYDESWYDGQTQDIAVVLGDIRGIEDIGAGSEDVLLMKLDPNKLH